MRHDGHHLRGTCPRSHTKGYRRTHVRVLVASEREGRIAKSRRAVCTRTLAGRHMSLTPLLPLRGSRAHARHRLVECSNARVAVPCPAIAVAVAIATRGSYSYASDGVTLLMFTCGSRQRGWGVTEATTPLQVHLCVSMTYVPACLFIFYFFFSFPAESPARQPQDEMRLAAETTHFTL